MYPIDGRRYVPFQPREDAHAWNIAPGASDDARVAALEAEMVRRIEDSKAATGAALVLIRNGEVVLAKGFGTVSPDGPSVTADTLFVLCSVGKTFTALTALSAAQRGLWDVDSSIQTWVPEAHAEITPRLALSHRAGVPDHSGCEPGLTTARDWARERAGQPLWSPVGALWNYSNSGYAMVAAGLEAAAGRPFDELVESWIFRPAGALTATYAPTRSASERAIGQGIDGTEPGGLDCGLIRAAGGAWLSANDIAAMLKALLAGADSPLGADVVSQVLTPLTSTSNGGRLEYGHGMFFERHGEELVAFHPGGLPWFGAGILLLPSRGFAVAYAVNGPDVRPMLHDALALFYPELERPPHQPTSEGWQNYAGIWEDTTGMLGRFSIEPAADHIRLVPLGGQEIWPIPLDATFWPNAEGEPHYFATRLGVARKQ